MRHGLILLLSAACLAGSVSEVQAESYGHALATQPANLASAGFAVLTNDGFFTPRSQAMSGPFSPASATYIDPATGSRSSATAAQGTLRGAATLSGIAYPGELQGFQLSSDFRATSHDGLTFLTTSGQSVITIDYRIHAVFDVPFMMNTLGGVTAFAELLLEAPRSANLVLAQAASPPAFTSASQQSLTQECEDTSDANDALGDLCSQYASIGLPVPATTPGRYEYDQNFRLTFAAGTAEAIWLRTTLGGFVGRRYLDDLTHDPFGVDMLNSLTITGISGEGLLGVRSHYLGDLALVDGAFRYPAAGNPNPGAVPEPSTWAMLIAGFTVAGAALRRRRVVA